jgi:hypothetical protein
VVFDKRERVPVHQNGRCESRQEALATPAGRLEMTGCLACGFIWNAAFEPDLLVYDARYENDQTCSDVFRAHVASCARKVVRGLAGLDRPRLVEVGCGQGTFYGIMAETLGALPGSAAGFDPAWRGKDGDGPANARLFCAYFDKATAALAGGRPDAVISRHTIEHVPDPIAFLSGIRDAVGGDTTVRLFIETPCSNWIVDNQQMQDLFYEHCSLFTAANLALAIERAGFAAGAVEHVFEGQYLWAEAGTWRGSGRGPAPAASLPRFDAWQSEKARYVERWRQAVAEAGAHGPVYLWGAGSKGVTFSLLIDPDGDALAGAVDVNPAKQGCFLPLTAVPVLPPQKLPPSRATVIIMNPAYKAEIQAQVHAMDRDVDFLSLAA